MWNVLIFWTIAVVLTSSYFSQRFLGFRLTVLFPYGMMVWDPAWISCYCQRSCRWRQRWWRHFEVNAFEIEVEEVAIDGVCVDEDLNVSSSFKIEFRTSASHPDLSSASRFFFYFRSSLLIRQVLEMTFCRSSFRWRDVLVRWSLFSKFTLVIPASNWLRCTNRPLGIYPIRPAMPIPPRIPGPYQT